MKKNIFNFIVILAGVIVALCLIEAAIAVSLAYPTKISKNIFGGFLSSVYFDEYRNIIQMDPEYTSYSSELVYLLKPGKRVFSNSEFSNEIFVNSAGIRDSEEALKSPEVIVVGDSVAMGWGVNQNESFPKVIEQLTGLRVLNASISSYGTPREMMLLNTLDRSKLKYLIIEYNYSDYEENAYYYVNKNTFPILQKEIFDRNAEDHLRRRKYYPGKYVYCITKQCVQKLEGVYLNESPLLSNLGKGETALFLNTLINGGKIDPDKVKIIVLEVPPRRDFVPSLIKDIETYKFSQKMGIKTIDLWGRLTSEDYYILDDHPRACAHRKIAEIIIREGGLPVRVNLPKKPS